MIEIKLDLQAVPVRLSLHGELSIEQAEPAQVELMRVLPLLPQAPLQIDLSCVEGGDSAGVQLLLAASAALRSSGRTATLSGCPQSLLNIVSALGAADAGSCCGFALSTREDVAP